jgi:hypothetical protein
MIRQRLRSSISRKPIHVLIIFLLAAPLFFTSCTNYIAYYDPIALDKAVSLKADSLSLMEKATEPYPGHERDVLELMSNMEKAYEYAAGLPKNALTTRQWEILKDPGKNLAGGFFKYWKEKQTLSIEFIKEATATISQAFDSIIQLEARKKR